jgi:hypothetical protein
MIQKAIGSVLLLVALVITILLLTGGGPLVPHMIGPITLAAVGGFLLTRPQKADRSVK